MHHLDLGIMGESQEIELRGHIIDSGIMTQLFDRVMDMGGNFEILVFDIGKKKTDPSYARLRINASSNEKLQSILSEVHRTYGQEEKKKQEADPQAWMFSFADLLTNMLTFFVLLYSMSSMNDLAFEYSAGPSLRGALGVINRGGYTSIGKPRFMPVSMPPTEEFALIEDAVVKALLTKTEDPSGGETMPVSENLQTIEIYANNKFAQILFPAQILFGKGSAEILPQMARNLEGIGGILKKFAHPIRINGYSGNSQQASGGHTSADISLKRASAVLQFFVSNAGLAPERCSLAGYGSLRNEERKGKSGDYVEIFIIKATNYTT